MDSHEKSHRKVYSQTFYSVTREMANVLKSQNELAHCVAMKMFIDTPTDSGDWDFIVVEKVIHFDDLKSSFCSGSVYDWSWIV